MVRWAPRAAQPPNPEFLIGEVTKLGLFGRKPLIRRTDETGASWSLGKGRSELRTCWTPQAAQPPNPKFLIGEVIKLGLFGRKPLIQRPDETGAGWSLGKGRSLGF